MNKSEFDQSDAINLVLEEYRSLESEKRSISQGSYTLASLVVVGSIAVLTAMMQTHNQLDRLTLMVVLLIGQLALVAVAIITVAMSLRYAMYLAVVEQRIDRIGGRKLLIWERKGVGNWPSSHAFEIKRLDAILKSQDPFIRASWVLVPLTAFVVLGEIIYADILMGEVISGIGLRITAAIGFPVVILALIYFAARGWINLLAWSKDVYRNYLADENVVIIRHAIEEFNKRNLSILDELIAPEMKNYDTSSTYPSDYEGVKQLLTNYSNSYPDLHITIEDMDAKDDEVTFRWVAQSKLLSDPVNHKAVTANVKVHMTDGKIVGYWCKVE